MAFDGIITRAAARELSEVLVDGRIDKIYEPEPDSIVLNIRTSGRSELYGASGVVRLFASCHSSGASVRLIQRNPENPKEPYPFCMLLRKHVQGSKIISVEQRRAERIIELTCERLNELGLMVTKKLIFEIMGKYSTIILVDMSRRSAKPGHPGLVEVSEDDGARGCMILGSIKGVPSGLSRVREVLPGRLYEYPPEQDKIPFDKASAGDLSFGIDSDATLPASGSEAAAPVSDSEAEAPVSGSEAEAPAYCSEAEAPASGSEAAASASGNEIGKALCSAGPADLRSYEPEAAREAEAARETDAARIVNASKAILKGIGGISPAVADELALRESGEDRKALIDETLAAIEAGTYTSRVYEDDQGIPRDFHIMRLSEYECLKEITFSSLSDCMDYYFEHREQTNRITQRSNELSRPVQAALEKLELKKQRLLEDLLRAEDSDKLRLYGELLTANMSMLSQGAKEVTVTSYYDGSSVTIPLDPRWSPSKNAQSYYKRYAKSKTAVKEKNRQLEDTNENIEYLESCLAFIENAGTIAELETLKAELEETGFIRHRQAAGRKAPRFKASPREYETTDGFTVLVGKNNRENDVLTLEIASRGDYWLHTKDIPGSHVILRSGGRDISDTAIMEAAGLAALYSKAKASENVPVDYVPIRYVKKPSGAKPGKVIFTHNKTVYVDPAEPGEK